MPAAVERKVLLVLLLLPTVWLCLGCRSAAKGLAALELPLPTLLPGVSLQEAERMHQLRHAHVVALCERLALALRLHGLAQQRVPANVIAGAPWGSLFPTEPVLRAQGRRRLGWTALLSLVGPALGGLHNATCLWPLSGLLLTTCLSALCPPVQTGLRCLALLAC